MSGLRETPPSSPGYRLFRLMGWVSEHRVRAALAALCLAALLTALVAALSPKEAEAVPIPIVVGGVLAVGGLLTGAFDAATGGVSDWLRDLCNLMLTQAVVFINNSTGEEMLTSSWGQIYPYVEPIVHAVHSTICIPISNVILVVCLLVGLGRVVSRLGQHEAGIDLWQIIMVFAVFTFAKVIIDSSYELLGALYNVAAAASAAIPGASGAATEITEVNGITEDMTGIGALVLCAIACFVIMIVSMLVGVVVQCVVMVRIVQIYAYTAFAAIPLAFLVSDSSRQIATGFVKKYLALLLAGLIMMFLMAAYTALVAGVLHSSDSPTDVSTLMTYIYDLLFSMCAPIVYAFCMVKAGGWARELLGAQ